jgi:muramoyltetrapeptide carboxypeptidase
VKLIPVKPGATIQWVTPASPLSADKLDFATNLLHSHGYKTKVAPHALEWDGYLAGSDRDRAGDLQAAFDDDETAAVFTTRGGYGCARLFPYLDLDRIVRSRKMLLGFSDVTALHVALNRRGMPTVHSPMALTLHYPREDWVYESLIRVLRGDLVPPSEAPAPTTVVGGVAIGKTVGGCMCLLTDSIGTPEELDTDGKILVIEDVDEQPHRIDAMFTHLVNSGLAAKSAGFVIGQMTRTDEHVDEAIGGRPWRDIITERLAPLGKPMIFDFPFGHMKGMLTIALGLMARLDADAGTLTFLEPLCE